MKAMTMTMLLLLTAAASTAVGQQLPTGTLDGLTRAQNFESRRASSSAEDMESNADFVPIPPGETVTLLDAEGPGVITHFWNTIAAFDPFSGRSVVIRVYYDGMEHPSVQVPLGDFFGVGHGAMKNFTSLPVSVSAYGQSRTCYWRMPFREHIKVTVSNESPVYPVPSFYYYLNWQKHEQLPEDTSYFHAEYRQSMPAAPGHYTILETEGKGHYVGTVYSAQQVEIGWFGEGDDFIYIDGADTPQLEGTGTEDYFNDAWGFGEFHTPYHGVTLYEGVYASDRVSAYRWHIQDPIAFEESIRVTIEHRGSVFDDEAADGATQIASSSERPDWLSSVGFWYQYPPRGIAEPLPPVDERIAPYQVIPASALDHSADPPDAITPSHVGINYLTDAPGASITFELPIEEDGRYRIQGLFEHSIMGAVWQAYLNGTPVGGPMDMVIVDGKRIWNDLDLHDLEAGVHELKFVKVDGHAPERRTIKLGPEKFTLEYLVLLRLEDMAGYRELVNAHRARQ